MLEGPKFKADSGEGFLGEEALSPLPTS